ncbi:MAG TPA: nucleotidyltransferase domain-containing protein [Syntrophomonadaceae bacterium]|nr:nucleotidyltransferase domain-containing protein [Syntrophomonadaceae bacterium]
MSGSFSTRVLDAVLSRKRREKEIARRKMIKITLSALEKLSERYPFSRAYIFGSLIETGRFVPGISDVDIAIEGLKDEDFFPAAGFLSTLLEVDVDLIQLEGHPLEDIIRKEGLLWMQRG